VAVYYLGSSSSDSLFGDGYDNYFLGFGGNDLIRAHGGVDRVAAGAGDDLVFGGSGDDVLGGDEGDDRLYGDAGNDALYGGAGADYLDGGRDSDYALGGDGNDLLLGGDGDDHLAGGRGSDWLVGGRGGDVFAFGADDVVMKHRWSGGVGPFDSGELVSYEAFETDTIADFQVTSDRVDLRSLLSEKTGFAGDTAFEAFWRGYIYYETHGTPVTAGFGTTLYVDRDGGTHDPAEDFAVADLAGIDASALHDWNFIV
jgi:Ca2+-binding RTX toxin-like protein